MEPNESDYQEIFHQIELGNTSGKFYDEREGEPFYNVFWEIQKTIETGQTRIIINKWKE